MWHHVFPTKLIRHHTCTGTITPWKAAYYITKVNTVSILDKTSSEGLIAASWRRMVRLMKELKYFSKRDAKGSSILSVTWIRSLDSGNLNPRCSERFGAVSVSQMMYLSISPCMYFIPMVASRPKSFFGWVKVALICFHSCKNLAFLESLKLRAHFGMKLVWTKFDWTSINLQ